MNIISVPFNDWRRIQSVGNRTRDAHLIQNMRNRDYKILIINRPTTLLELFLAKKGSINGRAILKKGSFKLYQIDPKTFLIDFISNDWIGQILKRHLWFISKYGDDNLLEFVEESCNQIFTDEPIALSHNPIAAEFLIKVPAQVKKIDAFDNLTKFPFYRGIKYAIEHCYRLIASDPNIQWVTNSKENREFFGKHFKAEDIQVVENGADTDLFGKQLDVPADMQSIPKPWIGFGGKISHLFDYDLFNHIAEKNPEKSFILIGQIIDKYVYSQIKKRSNVFYLGDKKYSEYIKYATNLDIAIIPYVVDDRKSGANSIKAYEFITNGKKVVGTASSGMENLDQFIYVASSQEEFSEFLDNSYPNKLSSVKTIPNFSWDSKLEQVLKTTKND